MKQVLYASLAILIGILTIKSLNAQNAHHNYDICTNEIWTTDSTHLITANITLCATATLTIQAGVEIRFQNDATFTIQGSVYADGLSSLIHIKGDTGDKGRFKLVSAGDSWFKYVNFYDGASLVIDNSDDVLVKNCDFFGGSAQRPTGLTIQNNADPEINQCQFYNDAYGMEITTASAPVISNCTFEGLANAMEIRSGASPDLLNCNFTNNNIGILIYHAGEPLITNCIMNENNFHGTEIEGASSIPLFTDCQFNQNTQSGIFIKNDGQGTFTNCQANLNISHGLYINYSDGSVTLNNFAANQNGGDGVHARQGNLIVSGLLEVNDNSGFGLNFYDDDAFDESDLQIADIEAHGNDTTAIRLPANKVDDILQPTVNLDFENNHPDGIEIFQSNITENTIWPEPPLNIDLYLGGLYIAEGASLEIIHPNTLTAIYCRQEAEIQVIGALKAENIEFLPAVEVVPPANKGYWKGICFSNSNGSELTNVTVKNAGYSDTKDRFAGIEINSSQPPQDSAVIINDCYIEDCAGDGIFIYQSNPLIKNTSVTGCDSTGIYMDYYASPIIDSCIIMQNGTYGIFCNHQYSGGTLNASQITNNQGPAVRLPMNMVGGLNNSTVTGNQRNQRIEIAGGYMTDDATWPGDMNYYVYKQIRTDPGKLTIEPGTVLKFMPFTDLTVKSSLTANGTSAQHIVFTSAQDNPSPGDWQGLSFHHATDTSYLTYCDIKYAGQSEWKPNIYTENSEVYLSHCDISYSGSSGIINMGGGDGRYLSITDCDIHHNQTHGLNSEWFWYNYTNLSHTNIYENGGYAIVAPADVLRFFTENIHLYANGQNAIKVTGGEEPGASDGHIHQGTWRNHGVPYEISKHITLVNGDTLYIEKGNTFYLENEITFWVDGMLSATANADSTITFDRMPGSTGHWQHILFKNTSKTSELEYCNFSHGGFHSGSKNDTASMISMLAAAASFHNCTVDSSYSNGIYLNRQASAELINTSINNHATSGIYIGGIGNNNLTFGGSLAEWNDIYDNGTYNISNNNPANINADYIWWGSIDSTEIAAGFLENTGTVNFTPWTNENHSQLYPADNTRSWTGTNSSDWNTADNWDPASVPTSDNEVIITTNGTAPVIALGTEASCNTLSVNTGATLTVQSGGSLTTSGTITNNGTLTIASDATGNGSLIMNGTASGPITAERYIAGHGGTADAGWHLIGSPVNNMAIAGSWIPASGSDDLYAWSEPEYLWLNYHQGDITNFLNGVGYLVAYQSTTIHSFSGTPNTGDVTVTLSWTDRVDDTEEGWNLLGNPYPSALIWGTGWDLANVQATAQVFNSSAKTYDAINADGIIPANQGFFVQANTTANGQNFTIPSAQRTHSSTAFYKAGDPNRLKLKVYPESASQFRDIFTVDVNDQAEAGFDAFDAYELYGMGDTPQLFAIDDAANNLSVQSIHPQALEDVTLLNLGVQAAAGSYVIEVESMLPDEAVAVILEDLETGTFTHLHETKSYTFTISEGASIERFLLHLGKNATSIETPETLDNEVTIFADNNRIYVKSHTTLTNATVSVYNTIGQLVSTTPLRAEQTLRLEQRGTYIIHVDATEGVSTQKVIIH
jgi:parallel beta-helix repeat protein